MGSSLKNFNKWIKKKRTYGGISPIQSTVMAIKMFNRQMRSQLKRMELQEKKARQKAEKRKERGDKLESRKLIRTALQYKKWQEKLEDYMFNLDDMEFQLNAALDMNNFEEVADQLLTILCEIKLTMGMPAVQALIDGVDFGFGSMTPVYEEYIEEKKLKETLRPVRVTEKEMKAELGIKDDTLDEEDFDALPGAPGIKEKATDLSDLEKQIEALKKKRGM